MSEYDNDLLREGILRAKVKEYDIARRYLERALNSSDDLQTRMHACFWLSEITADPVEKRKYLEEVLAIDRNHAQARRSLAILDGRLKPEEIIDPDRLPAPANGPRDVKADRFTCPKCGGRMVYAADGGSLVCEFCQRNQPLAQASAAGQDFLLAMATLKGHSEPVATQVFQCRGCGADFVLPPQVMTAACAYCGSDHIVALAESRDLVAPDAIIPMAFDQEQAAWRLVRWVEANRLEPEDKVQAPQGIYLPVWVFDTGGEIPWNGIQIRDKQRVEVPGLRSVHYYDLAVPATRKLAGLLAKILPGYNFPAAAAYDPRFLTGWLAEVYQVAMSDAALEARRMAVERVRREIESDEGHLLDLHYSPSNIAIESFRLALVPLWMTAVRLEGREYRVVINGQTGAVHGETPSRGLLDWLGSLVGVT
jgi:DNA-directed RNA polymerase subunit RPC12/RpoP